MNDNLTLAGLVALGLTSALVGALVVAPTLAPKRMAMAAEKPKEPAKPDRPPIADAMEAALRAAGVEDPTGNASAAASEVMGLGNVPGANAPGGPEEAPGNAPVTIRTPEERADPPAASNLGAPSSQTDRRELRREGEPSDSSRRDRRNRRGSEEETAPAERTRTETEPSSASPTPEPSKENESKPDEGASSERSSENRRVYRVQSGKFNTREEALKVQQELAKSGKGGFIVPAGDGFRLQLGVFQSRENAEKAAETARAQSIIVDVRQERQAQR